MLRPYFVCKIELKRLFEIRTCEFQKSVPNDLCTLKLASVWVYRVFQWITSVFIAFSETYYVENGNLGIFLKIFTQKAAWKIFKYEENGRQSTFYECCFYVFMLFAPFFRFLIYGWTCDSQTAHLWNRTCFTSVQKASWNRKIGTWYLWDCTLVTWEIYTCVFVK